MAKALDRLLSTPPRLRPVNR